MTLNKTVLAGHILIDRIDAPVFCHITITPDGRLSITGVEGPRRNGDAVGSCGQIADTLVAPGFIPAAGIDTARLWSVWTRWHLNDMRANCAHQQGEGWEARQQLDLQPLTWGDRFHAERRKAEAGEHTPDEYAEYCRIRPVVDRLTMAIARPKHPALWGESGEALLSGGFVKLDRPERRAAGHVSPAEHPAGLLAKPCPVCGYKYGTAWLREDLPQDVIDFLTSLPDSPITPAWA